MITTKTTHSTHSTTLTVNGDTFQVWNSFPQHENATAKNMRTGKKMIIGSRKERLDLSDTDELESRIIGVLGWQENFKDMYN